MATYIAFDGDDVGSRIEYYLLRNDEVSLSSFSATFTDSLNWLKSELLAAGGRVILSGGDNILLELADGAAETELLLGLLPRFRERTGCTLSIGIGASPREAFLALKYAKVSGKNCIRTFADLTTFPVNP